MSYTRPAQVLLNTNADANEVAHILIPPHDDEDHFSAVARRLIADVIRAHRTTISRRKVATTQKE